MKLVIGKIVKESGYKTEFVINYLGISKKTWYNWVNNKTDPGFKKMIKLSQLTGRPLTDFYEE